MTGKLNRHLTQSDIAELTGWRRELHRFPELSGEEERTAKRVVEMLQLTQPDRIVTGLGGYGVAALYDSGRTGPCVLLRSELDGLPIEDIADIPHRSVIAGKGHLCGHDGHTAILAAMARMLGRERPSQGSVLLMFQPAEEDGTGAEKVVHDPAFNSLKIDYAFAIHNMPGIPLGSVAIVEGPVTCASRGMKLTLSGRTAHASQPETGISPMQALVRLMPELTALGNHSTRVNDAGFSLVTITHANMGIPAFGITPGQATLYATLRSLTNEKMKHLVDQAERLAHSVAESEKLDLTIEYQDVFVACVNDSKATSIVCSALDDLHIPYGSSTLPLRNSEDFGRFGTHSRLAFILLGSGEDAPSLHNPDFDFPDVLIEKGANIYSSIIKKILC